GGVVRRAVVQFENRFLQRMIRESWRGGMKMKQIALIAAIALPSVAILSCNSIARESAPVMLVVSGTQNLNQVDLQPGAVGCATSLGTVQLSVRLLQDQKNTKLPT